MRDDEVPPQGGKPGWAGLPNPRIAPWFRRLKKIAQEHGLIPEFEVSNGLSDILSSRNSSHLCRVKFLVP